MSRQRLIEYWHGCAVTDCRVFEVPIRIRNNQLSANQLATVKVTSTGLTLRTLASGTDTENTTITWATYTTVNAVKTAVAAISGWTATVTDALKNFPSSDLYDLQGPFDALGKDAELKLHAEALADYNIDADHGFLIRTDWPRGFKNIRVIYTGGFPTVPEEVQEACALLSAAWFKQTKRDPALFMERTSEYTYQTAATFHLPFPGNVLRLLMPYRLVYP